MKKLRITVSGKVYEVDVEIISDDGASVSTPAPSRPVVSSSVAAPVSKPAPPAPVSAGGPGSITSPLAGKVVSILVKPGDSVPAGANVIVLEAMKMNTHVSTTDAGTVQEIHVKPGDAVEEGQILVTMA